MTGLPTSGSVVGLDVGWSSRRRSSAICRLDWSASAVSWTIARFAAIESERAAVIDKIVDRPVLAAGVDGPLARGFQRIGRYRLAERMLTLRLQPLIGKPGSSGSPVGSVLNGHANLCACAVLAPGHVAAASHAHAIDAAALVEAFPSSFMGLLLDHPEEIAARRGDRSDRFFEVLTANGGLHRMLDQFLPGRSVAPFEAVTDHDDRAALVCALTALCVAAGEYVAVGDELGWIILPPAWAMARWAMPLLEANAARCGGGLAVASPLHA